MARPKTVDCECGRPLGNRSRNQGCIECYETDKVRHRAEPIKPQPLWQGGMNILHFADGQSYMRAHTYRLPATGDPRDIEFELDDKWLQDL